MPRKTVKAVSIVRLGSVKERKLCKIGAVVATLKTLVGNRNFCARKEQVVAKGDGAVKRLVKALGGKSVVAREVARLGAYTLVGYIRDTLAVESDRANPYRRREAKVAALDKIGVFGI